MPLAFDADELLGSLDGDLVFLAEMVQMLADDGPQLLAEMRAALAGGDTAAVGRVAHTMKGMLGNFCAAEARASALALEHAGNAGDAATAAAAFAALDVRFAALITELQGFVAARS